jgi:MarR-like DNA-binding transcriptional regulator SgrR of sgrS sRNA
MTYPDGTIPVEKVIAKKYEISDDYRTYTFDLKEGVAFHDGSEVTASDFVYSWRRLAGSENTQAAADILSAINVVHETTDEGKYESGSLAVEAVDDYTFRFEVEEPFAPTLQVISNNQFAAVPEGIVGDVPGYEGEIAYEKFATESPVGAGPFEFEMWEQGTQVSVAANEEYHGVAPKVDGNTLADHRRSQCDLQLRDERERGRVRPSHREVRPEQAHGRARRRQGSQARELRPAPQREEGELHRCSDAVRVLRGVQHEGRREARPAGRRLRDEPADDPRTGVQGAG